MFRFYREFISKPRVEDMSLLARDDLAKMRESFNLREKDIEAQESLIASRAIELNSQSELIEQDRQNLLSAWSNYQATLWTNLRNINLFLQIWQIKLIVCLLKILSLFLISWLKTVRTIWL